MPRHRDLAAFGAAMRRYRERMGISQEALAERSRLHRTYVGGVERGERNVGLINVYRLADALAISPTELFASGGTSAARGRTTTTTAFTAVGAREGLPDRGRA